MPVGWLMPKVSSRSVPARVVVHPPVESEGKTEKEVSEEVRQAIIRGLPEEQRPAQQR